MYMRLPNKKLCVGAHQRKLLQSGITLIVVLLILVVVTILGIGGAQIALLAERSTRYDRDYLVASQAAEAALTDAEFDISATTSTRAAQFTQSNTGVFIEGCGNGTTDRGLCSPTSGTKPIWSTVDFLDETAAARTVAFGTFTGRAAEFAAGVGGVRPERMPRYIIEVVDDFGKGKDLTEKRKAYRVTAIGFGPRTDVQVVMQSTYRKGSDL